MKNSSLRLNDNTTGLRQKMVNIGVPDFNVGYNSSEGSFHNIGNSGNIYHRNQFDPAQNAVNSINEMRNFHAYSQGAQAQWNNHINHSISNIATSTIGQLGFGISTSIGKGAMTAIEKEHIRQVVINQQLAHPNFRLSEAPNVSFRTPKWLRFAGKWGGSVFSAWGVYDIRNQYRTGQISESEMWREQGSNLVGWLPIAGTGWTGGWETGRAVTNTSGYQRFKYSFWKSYYEWSVGSPLESNPVYWNYFHRNYKP